MKFPLFLKKHRSFLLKQGRYYLRKCSVFQKVSDFPKSPKKLKKVHNFNIGQEFL